MTHWWVVAVLAAVFVLALTQFVRHWRAMRATPSACPSEVECRTSDSAPPEAAAAEPEAPPPREPEGLVSPWGASCTSDMYNTGAGPCGPNCMCAHCRGGKRCGAGCACAKCRGQRGAAVKECHSMHDVEAAMAGEGVMLMHMTGCPPCEALKPRFFSAAPRAAIPFFAVDAVRVPAIAQRFNLVGYPTVMRFSGGRIVSEYQGDRSEQDLLLFASSTL